MAGEKVVVVVEEADAARTALQWAACNIFRGSDSITLLYVCPSTKSKKKKRSLRLKGFQLALSFKDLCNGIAEAKVEILVMEGDTAAAVVSLVNEIGASTLVVGLHEQSFLYKASSRILSANNFKCRILAVKQQSKAYNGYTNMDISEIEITSLCVSKARHSSVSFFPLSLGMICRRSKRRRAQTHRG